MTVTRLKDMNLNPPSTPDFNAIASKVKAIAARDDIPRTVRPSDVEGQGALARAAPVQPSDLAKSAPKETAQPVAAPLKRLAVHLPDYVVDDIHARALNSTARFVVLKALKSAGFHVNASDLVEDRRRR
jgi:hypothetical protein